jgi:hypothetical protein
LALPEPCPVIAAPGKGMITESFVSVEFFRSYGVKNFRGEKSFHDYVTSSGYLLSR